MYLCNQFALTHDISKKKNNILDRVKKKNINYFIYEIVIKRALEVKNSPKTFRENNKCRFFSCNFVACSGNQR